MTDNDKTVFISYRRDPSRFHAQAIFYKLQDNGYDVFLDVVSIDSGEFDRIILNQIKARAHFLILLAPGTLARCVEPDDWVRKEIETAIELDRNIVPVLLDGFDFRDETDHMPGKLEHLKRLNSVKVPHEYFEEAMNRLVSRFLKPPEYKVEIEPTPIEEVEQVNQRKEKIGEEPEPTKEDLSAEYQFSLGIAAYQHGDLENAIEHYTEAITLNPNYNKIYYNRGIVFQELGKHDEALADYTDAIALDPKYPKPFVNRGVIYDALGEHQTAIEDYNQALDANPQHASAYLNRANAYIGLGEFSLAQEDLETYLDLEPDSEYREHILSQIQSIKDFADSSLTEPKSPDFNSVEPVTRPVGPPPPRGRTSIPDGVTQPILGDRITIQRTEHISFGQASDVGMVRNTNQDAIASFYFTSKSIREFPGFGLFVLSDGMGGHHDGEKAAATAVQVVTEQINLNSFMPLLVGLDEAEPMPLTEALIKAVKDANEIILSEVPEGGTTVTAVAIIGDLAHIAHVGDSRAYLMTTDGIDQITRDHSLVQRLIELGQLTPEEAEVHPQKNVLYRALGQSETLEVDTSLRRLPPNSRLVICSDGLWGQVEEQELYEHAMNNTDPQQACDKLAALANARVGFDNISVICISIS